MKVSKYIIPAFAALMLGMQSCGGDSDDIVVDVAEKTYSVSDITNTIETTLIEAQKNGEKVDLYFFDKDNLTYQMAFGAQKNVKYSVVSSDSEVASVDENGLITALKPGKTTVTLECGSLKKTLEVACHNFKVTQEKMVCSLGYDSRISLLKSEAANLTFKSSNTEIVTVTEEGVVKGIAEGEATITISDGVESVVVAVEVFKLDSILVNDVVYLVDQEMSEIDGGDFYLRFLESSSYIHIQVDPNGYGLQMDADYWDETYHDGLYYGENGDGYWADESSSCDGYFIVEELESGTFVFTIDMTMVFGDQKIVIKADNVKVQFNNSETD